MVLLGSWNPYRALSILAVFGFVITAIYMLKAIRLGFQGPLKLQWAQLTDAQTPLAKLPFVLLLAVLILIGCWPSLILKHIDSSTKTIAESVR